MCLRCIGQTRIKLTLTTSGARSPNQPRANNSKEASNEKHGYRNPKRAQKKTSVSNLKNIPQIDLTEILKEKIKNKQKQGYSLHNSHHIKYPKTVHHEIGARKKISDNDLVLYTRHIPNLTQIHHKHHDVLTNRAHQVTNLKEKLKLKYKHEEDAPFPSLYKITEDFGETNQSPNKHKSLTGQNAKTSTIVDT